MIFTTKNDEIVQNGVDTKMANNKTPKILKCPKLQNVQMSKNYKMFKIFENIKIIKCLIST